LGRTQKSQAASDKKLKAYACELEQKLEARTRELSEAREQQAATAEVLQVISSSPGKLEPVFETILANATRLCEAKFGTLFLCEGDAFRVASMHNAPLAYAKARTRMPIVRARRDTALWRAANVKRAAQEPDITKEQAYLEGDPFVVDAATLGGYRAILDVPMLKKTRWPVSSTLPPGGAPVQRQADRNGGQFRRPGCHRHREHAPAQRAAPAHRRSERVTGTADRNLRGPACHLELTDRRPA